MRYFLDIISCHCFVRKLIGNKLKKALDTASEKVMNTMAAEIEYYLSTIGLKNLWNVMFGPLKNLFDSLDAKIGIGGCAFPKFVPVGTPGAAIQNKDTVEGT